MTTKSLFIDWSNSKVAFQVKKLGIFTIKGSITGFTGELAFSENALIDSSIHVCVSPSTINTGNKKRDEHLKSKDFFLVKEYPKICFQSTSIKSTSNGYEVVGSLAMLGATKKVTIPFSFSDGVVEGKFTINRSEFKLGEKFPAIIVGKTIEIQLTSRIK